MRLALLMIVAMALLHKTGMFFRLGRSGSFSISLACVWVCLVYWGSAVDGVLVFVLGNMRLTVFLSRVDRFNFLVYDFVMGGCSFVVVSFMGS